MLHASQSRSPGPASPPSKVVWQEGQTTFMFLAMIAHRRGARNSGFLGYFAVGGTTTVLIGSVLIPAG